MNVIKTVNIQELTIVKKFIAAMQDNILLSADSKSVDSNNIINSCTNIIFNLAVYKQKRNIK